MDDDFSLLNNNPNPNQNNSFTHDESSDPDPNPTRNDLTNTGTSKRTKTTATSSNSNSEYRKDREEWSDTAIAYLLQIYSDKLEQLSRGNLRGRDWEDVAVSVSDRCQNQVKSVEQCKNKVDNLKKRFKLEKHRLSLSSSSNNGGSVSHWPWFKQMEKIVGSGKGNGTTKMMTDEEEKGSGTGVVVQVNSRQTKRPATAITSPSGPVISLKKSTTNVRWRRVVFKISGTALAGGAPNNIDPEVALLIAKEVSIACRLGVEVAIVLGGRNFFCGDTWVTSTGLDRCTAYQIGMMATVMNSILLQSALEKFGVQTRVQSAFSMPEVAEPYSRQRAIRHLEKGRVVIFGGIGAGTGNPLFSTDTAAALRASEIHANAVLKGTNMDGINICDSRNNNVPVEQISFRELATRGASPMDLMAMTFCEENGIPVVVFNLHEPGNISRALCGEQVGTLIDQTGAVC